MTYIYFLFVFFSSFSYACSSLLNTDMKILDSSQYENFCKYEDKVMLVVNVASRCGYTYQYEGLQNLYDKYKDNGLVVVGIPSRDFMQEFSVEKDVAEFCSTEYGVDFPMYSTTKVRGKKAHPFYKKLFAESGVSPGWNFYKYLISREGKVIKSYNSGVKPDSEELLNDIENLL